MTDPPEILGWQESYVKNVEGVLRRNYLATCPAINVLDAGCDPSGKQLWHLAGLVRGNVTGINIHADFPSDEALAVLRSRPNARLMRMDALEMDFEDESFDVVISANVIEHISDPSHFFRECGRVLKRTGVAYFETYPIWTSARGHHIHEDMIGSRFPKETYTNDGRIIPNWSHLIYDEIQMRSIIEAKLKAPAVDYVLDYIYHSTDINRKGWREISSAFRSVFPIVQFETHAEYPRATTGLELKPAGGLEDHDVAGIQVNARKAPHNVFVKPRLALRNRMRQMELAVSRRMKEMSR
jgi:ubiquinone/menaquinone biosynthesis C-methylase UbiE